MEDSEVERAKMLESLEWHTQKIWTVAKWSTLVYTDEQMIPNSIVYLTLEETHSDIHQPGAWSTLYPEDGYKEGGIEEPMTADRPEIQTSLF